VLFKTLFDTIAMRDMDNYHSQNVLEPSHNEKNDNEVREKVLMIGS